jgi:hypothetical protein
MPAIQPPPVPPAAPSAPVDWFTAVDEFVFTIYRTGFVQRLILHVVVLLLLAVIIIRPDLPRQAVVALEFTAAGSEPEPDVATLDMPAPEELAVPEDAEPLPLADLPEAEPDLAIDVVEPADFAMDAEVAEPDAAALLADVAVPVAARGPRPAAAPAAGGGGGGGGAAIGGEIGRRLAVAGAGTGDVQISIAWNNVNDIDLHVMVEPAGQAFAPSIINFTNRIGIAGGCLDVDRNVHPTTVTPVENVFWGRGAAPFGRYTVAVHHYRDWGGGNPTDVEVVVLVDGEVERFKVRLQPGDPFKVVTAFLRLPPNGGYTAAPAASLPVVRRPLPTWQPAPVRRGGGGGGPALPMIPLKPTR